MSLYVNNLNFAYRDKQVLHDVSFNIDEGTLVNLLGPNGVGKSTLFRCILGLTNHYDGSIKVNGKEVRELSAKQRAQEMAYIPQSHRPVFDYDVLDVVMMSAASNRSVMSTPKKEDAKRAYESLARVGVEYLAGRPYTHISGGEQQLVLIARALAQNANTLIMDEPTSALDFGNTIKVLSAVRKLAEEGLTIIQSTHQPDQAFLYSDKTLVLHDGRVLSYGPPKETITDELISKIYNVDCRVSSLYDDAVRVCIPVEEIQSHLEGQSSAHI